ncbi:MAG: hypothetical protein ACOY0T_33455, partial [Myxococcota bacterium]
TNRGARADGDRDRGAHGDGNTNRGAHGDGNANCGAHADSDAQVVCRGRVLSALCAMGFGRREAARALEQLGDDGEEDCALLLRRALARLVPDTSGWCRA